MAERRDDDIDIEEQADAVADFVEELLTRMEIDAIAEPTDEGGRMYVDILDGDDSDMALLIGKQGATLDAIQELVRQVVGRRLAGRIRWSAGGSTNGSACSSTWRTTASAGRRRWKRRPVQRPRPRLNLARNRRSS